MKVSCAHNVGSVEIDGKKMCIIPIMQTFLLFWKIVVFSNFNSLDLSKINPLHAHLMHFFNFILIFPLVGLCENTYFYMDFHVDFAYVIIVH
jgi:hypothetical protein